MSDKIIQVSKVLPFPKRQIADIDICKKIDGMWDFDKKFMILSGPPGVGKTRTSEDYIYRKLEVLSPHLTVDATRLSNLFPEFRTKVYSTSEITDILSKYEVKFVWDLAVLHPQYSYEDLIRGYKVFPLEKSSTLKVREGLLGFMSRVVEVLEASTGLCSEPQGLLVLDEINRAPIGQLFGEAIYALDRRGQKTTTPYELEGFDGSLVIPKTLMILGTMNSIDRATSGFDYALRRRFANIFVKPSRIAVEEIWNNLNSTVKMIGPQLFDITKELIIGSEQLGTIPKEELVLGQAYFIPPENSRTSSEDTIKWMLFSYLYQIFPTLLDYQEQGLLQYDEDAVGRIPMGNILLNKDDIYQTNEEMLEHEFKGFFNAGK
ncbi:hypothetical protein RJ44_19875 [Alteromonas macleodii]|uniref:AAA family ATPase n=1 Tax=Alteromonas macleodii TaxID=28108 RepID=UPI00057C360B|nr:AAA family ATPase [Alteromonas macleodii]KHT53259.1 hypothetical protein RJ44_19875 [Alteromonas macleodii]